MKPLPPRLPSVDVTEAARLLRERTPPPLIVDVREPGEFAGVRIEDSVLVPMSTFSVRHPELPKDRPLLVLCAMGGRSAAATAHLLKNGWTDVTNVDGGIDAWQRAGLPVRTGPPAPGEGQLV